MSAIKASFPIEIMHSGMLDIDQMLSELRQLNKTEEDAYIQVKQIISMARLVYEESLKPNFVHEIHYRDLADQIDDLIHHITAIRAFPPAACCRQWNRGIHFEKFFKYDLLSEFERIHLRLKTIEVVCPNPRPRKYYPKTANHHCWVDANGFRVRDPALAVNAPRHLQQQRNNDECPGAPVKDLSQREPVDSLPEPTALYFDYSDEEEFDSWGKREQRACIEEAEHNKFRLAQPKPDFDPKLREFKAYVETQLASIRRINETHPVSPDKFLKQCDILQNIFSYLLDHSEYVFLTRKLADTFVPVVIRKTMELAGQIEILYNQLRSQTKRVDPSVRSKKCATVSIINNVHKAYASK